MKVIGKFDPSKKEIFSVLDQSGNTNKYDPKLSKKDCIKIYTDMMRSRLLDEKALKLQRSGKMGTFAQAIGQEACQAPIALLFEKKDWIVPSFRENCLFIAVGNPMHKFLQYYGGNENGSNLKLNYLPTSVPVGSHMLHAVGIGWAANIRKEKITVFTFFGDGATSEGDFHAAMNFGAVYKSPVIFISQNNQYAISLPVSKQTASASIAQKSCAYGLPGIIVDGNDPLAMYVATKEAKEHTRKGKGPVLIEAFTYRLAPHTTSDDPSMYRTKKEEDSWKKKDPIPRFEKYLIHKKYLNQESKEKIIEDAKKEIDEQIKMVELNKSVPDDMFKWLYAEMTPELVEQRQYLQQFLGDDK